MSKIVVIGSSNTDMVIQANRLPVPGETIIGGEFMMNPGGKGANQAVAVARMDGESIVPLLTEENPNTAERPIFWHFPHYSNHGLQSPGGAIRLGDYKLLDYFENNTVQLFNLKDDIGEQNDLAKSNPAKADELKKLLDAWRIDVDAQMMEINEDYDPNAIPSDFNTRKAPVKK